MLDLGSLFESNHLIKLRGILLTSCNSEFWLLRSACPTSLAWWLKDIGFLFSKSKSMHFHDLIHYLFLIFRHIITWVALWSIKSFAFFENYLFILRNRRILVCVLEYRVLSKIKVLFLSDFSLLRAGKGLRLDRSESFSEKLLLGRWMLIERILVSSKIFAFFSFLVQWVLYDFNFSCLHLLLSWIFRT